MSYQQTVAGYLRDRERRDMKDELRDVLLAIDGITAENAKVIADTIREAIDKRGDALGHLLLDISQRVNALEHVPAKPKPRHICEAIPQVWMDAAEEEMNDAPYCTYREGHDGAHSWMREPAKMQAAEPRRNPYEDAIVRRVWAGRWELVLGSRSLECATRYGAQSTRAALIEAWNEGAQIAGGRDE